MSDSGKFIRSLVPFVSAKLSDFDSFLLQPRKHLTADRRWRKLITEITPLSFYSSVYFYCRTRSLINLSERYRVTAVRYERCETYFYILHKGCVRPDVYVWLHSSQIKMQITVEYNGGTRMGTITTN